MLSSGTGRPRLGQSCPGWPIPILLFCPHKRDATALWKIGHLLSCGHCIYFLIHVAFQLYTFQLRKKGKQLEFLKLLLGASVFDHTTGTKGLSGLKKFLTVLLPNKLSSFFFWPSSLIPSGDSSSLVQVLVGVFVCQKFSVPTNTNSCFPWKAYFTFFQSPFLPWLSVLYQSKKKISLWVFEPSSNLIFSEAKLFQKSYFDLMEKLPELF